MRYSWYALVSARKEELRTFLDSSGSTKNSLNERIFQALSLETNRTKHSAVNIAIQQFTDL